MSEQDHITKALIEYVSIVAAYQKSERHDCNSVNEYHMIRWAAFKDAAGMLATIAGRTNELKAIYTELGAKP